MTNRYRRLVTTRLMPAALLSLLNLTAQGEVVEGATSSLTPHPPVGDLSLMHELLTVIARTRSFNEVTKYLDDHATRPRRFELADWGASYRFQRSTVMEIMIRSERVSPGQRRADSNRVVAIQAIFQPNKVRLSDLEVIFGHWYRDPPDGQKVSLASAYFNAKRIHPQASYFLLATTGAGYEEALSASEYAQTLAATWSDDRYSSTGRPW